MKSSRVGLSVALVVAVGLWSCGTQTPETDDQLPSTLSVEIGLEPVANPEPLKMAFSVQSNGQPAQDTWSFVWDFGDGSQSVLPSPEHVYSAPGAYDVKVEASNGTARGEDVLPVEPLTVDLTIVDVVVSPAAALAGDSVVVGVFVRNNGILPSAAAVANVYLLDTATWPEDPGTPDAAIHIPAVDGGDTYDSSGVLTVPETLTPGDYYLFAFIDGPISTIAEYDEDNNIQQAPGGLTVTEEPEPTPTPSPTGSATPAAAP